MSRDARIVRGSRAPEAPIAENCFIVEWSNSADDPALSIARARVAPGETTRWHRLHGITERYLVLSGRGRVEAGGLPPTEVGPGDVVIIPPGCRQRISNREPVDLVFVALCTPRFTPDAYEDIEGTQDTRNIEDG